MKNRSLFAMALSFAALSSVAAGKCWWEGPSLRAKVKTCPSIAENNQRPAPHYINTSADGSLLLVDNSCQHWDYSHPVQLYRVSDLLSRTGTVDGVDFAVASQGAKDIFAGTIQDKTATGPGGWKGGAVCGSVAVVGNARSSGQHFASFSTSPAGGTWVENTSAFTLTAGDFGFDSPDFNGDASALYTNDGTTQNRFVKWTCADFLVAGATMTQAAAYSTSVKRMRSLNVYTVGGTDLVYYGEGGNDSTHPAKVYVWDTDGSEILLVDCSSALTESNKDITNVKVSGLGTTSPYLYVGTDGGELLVYQLAADGKSVSSATPVKSFTKAQIAAMCGRAALTSFRAFEVTPDGSTAFFALNASTTEPQGLLTVIGYKSPIVGSKLPQNGLVVNLDASDPASMTLDSSGRVLSWRSQVNDLSFVPAIDDSPNETTHVPYYVSELPIPATAKVPGVVFGFAPGSPITGTTSDYPYRMRTSLKSNKSVVSKQVVMVAVMLNSSTSPTGATGYDGESLAGVDGSIFYSDGSTTDRMYFFGNAWSRGVISGNGFFDATGKAWLSNSLVLDWANAIYETYGNLKGFRFNSNYLQVLDALGNESGSHEGYPQLSGTTAGANVAMEVCEVAIYNRELSADEHAAVDGILLEKWKTKNAKRVWTGAGVTTKWTDCGNWSGFEVPSTGEKVILSGDSVELDEVVKARVSIDLNGASLTVPGIETGNLVTNSVVGSQASLIVANGAAAKLDAVVGGNVAVTKTGAGKLEVSAFQSYAGATTLEGGSFVAVTNVAIDAMAGITCHLDASRPDTIATNAAGEVVSWRSTDSSAVEFLPGWLADTPNYPAANHNGRVWFTLDQGVNPSVVFGKDPDNVFTGMFMKASSYFPNQTVFAVTRQLDVRCGSLVGDYSSYNSRVVRGANGAWCWASSGGSEVHSISGVPKDECTKIVGTSDEGYPVITVQDASPHLLVVRRSTSHNSNVIGVSYVTREVSNQKVVFGQFRLMELIAFDRQLTDDEIWDVSAWLMAKWGVTPQKTCVIGDTLSPSSQVVVKGDVQIDFGGMGQTLADLVIDADGNVTAPLLTVVGNLDLSGIDLVLRNAANVSRSRIIDATSVEGEFSSVTGLDDKHTLTVKNGSSVWLRLISGLLLLFH